MSSRSSDAWWSALDLPSREARSGRFGAPVMGKDGVGVTSDAEPGAGRVLLADMGEEWPPTVEILDGDEGPGQPWRADRTCVTLIMLMASQRPGVSLGTWSRYDSSPSGSTATGSSRRGGPNFATYLVAAATAGSTLQSSSVAAATSTHADEADNVARCVAKQRESAGLSTHPMSHDAGRC